MEWAAAVDDSATGITVVAVDKAKTEESVEVFAV